MSSSGKPKQSQKPGLSEQDRQKLLDRCRSKRQQFRHAMGGPRPSEISPEMSQMMGSMGGMSQKDLSHYLQEMTKSMPPDQMNGLLAQMSQQYPGLAPTLRRKINKSRKQQGKQKSTESDVKTSSTSKSTATATDTKNVSDTKDGSVAQVSADVHPDTVGRKKKGFGKVDVAVPDMKDVYGKQAKTTTTATVKEQKVILPYTERLKIWQTPCKPDTWTAEVCQPQNQGSSIVSVVEELPMPDVILDAVGTRVTYHEIPQVVRDVQSPTHLQQVLFKKHVFQFHANAEYTGWVRFHNYVGEFRDLKQRYIKIVKWLKSLQEGKVQVDEGKLFSLLERYSVHYSNDNLAADPTVMYIMGPSLINEDQQLITSCCPWIRLKLEHFA